MMEKKGVVFVISAFILVSVLFVALTGYYFIRSGSFPFLIGDIATEYPFFPNKYYTLDPSREWRIDLFQPIILGFEKTREANYLIVKYTKDEKVYKVKVFITGRLDNGEYVDSIYVNDKTNRNIGEFSFDQVREILTKGDQIGIEYLSNVPSDPDGEFCQKIGGICKLSTLVIKQKEQLGDFREERVSGEDLVIPANLLYTTLYGI